MLVYALAFALASAMGAGLGVTVQQRRQINQLMASNRALRTLVRKP